MSAEITSHPTTVVSGTDSHTIGQTTDYYTYILKGQGNKIQVGSSAHSLVPNPGNEGGITSGSLIATDKTSSGPPTVVFDFLITATTNLDGATFVYRTGRFIGFDGNPDPVHDNSTSIVSYTVRINAQQ